MGYRKVGVDRHDTSLSPEEGGSSVMEEVKVLFLEGGRRPSHQIREELKPKGIAVTQVQDLPACLEALKVDRDQTVIMDLDLYRQGIEALHEIVKISPDIPVIVIASLERLAVVDGALKEGAWDFVIKQPDLSHLQELPQAISRNREQRMLQAETRAYQQEIQSLQEALREARDAQVTVASQKGNWAGDEVLVDISEDLKTPLAAMKGFLEIASTISPDKVEPNQLLSIQRIDALATRLLDFVSNHMGALEIEAGRFEIHKSRLNIHQLLELAVEGRKSEADAKNVEIVLETAGDLPLLSVDPVQMERTVGILISNAIALSPSGGGVTISSSRNGNEIAVAVKDSGAGVSEEEIPALFERKKKLRRRGGDLSTVGLFVARHIVVAHGGRIEVQSDPLEGTTLTISLPV